MSNEDTFSGQDDPYAQWIAIAIMASLLLHVIFWFAAEQLPVHIMNPSHYDRIVPRKFHLGTVEVKPEILESDDTLLAPVQQTAVTAPPDAITFADEVIAAPQASLPEKIETTTPMQSPVTDIPIPAPPDLSSLQGMSALDDPEALRKTLVSDRPTISVDPRKSAEDALHAGGGLPAGAVAGANVKGYSNLDDLLGKGAKVGDSTAPILMPTDLLFSFNSAELMPSAIDGLAKLGELIQRNPQAIFTIEGHTDSIGDDAYNLALSSERAQNVLDWLSSNFQIPANHLQAQGRGKTKLLVKATGEPESERLNRRVEIIIKTLRTKRSR